MRRLPRDLKLILALCLAMMITCVMFAMVEADDNEHLEAAYGTGPEPVETGYIKDAAECGTSPAPTPRLTSLGTFTATAYSADYECCGKTPDDPLYGITATGTVATEGRTIAVDPSVIPYGTTVYIGGQAYVAEDCGGAIKGNKVDIFFNSYEDALSFGVQEVQVWQSQE